MHSFNPRCYVVAISCATDAELEKMSKRSSYTEYYRSLIKTEIERRNQSKGV